MPQRVPTEAEFQALERTVSNLQAAHASLDARVVALEHPEIPTPEPIDCVLSDWKLEHAGEWGPCHPDGTQTRSETWTRAIVTAPAHGGAACGPTGETRIGTQQCTPGPVPVHCVQGVWSAWSPWSAWVPAGPDTEQRTRTRTRATLVEPAHGGDPCGPSTETDTETRPTLPPPTGGHEYFDALVARPDTFKAISWRGPNDLKHKSEGGYADVAPLTTEYYVTYDPVQDAARVAIPAFLEWFNSKQLAVAAALDASQATATLVSDSADLITRSLKIDNEIVTVTAKVGLVLTITRAQFGTTAEPHAAGALLKVSSNSLQNQIRYSGTVGSPSLGTKDGHTYLFIWDVKFDESYLGSGLTNHKWFTLTHAGDSKWFELQSAYGNNFGATCYTPGVTVSSIAARTYNPIGGVADWALTNGNVAGPGVTKDQPILFPGALPHAFCTRANTWIRLVVRVEQRANDYDYVSVWLIDETQPPMNMYLDVPLSLHTKGTLPRQIDKWWAEFGTSTIKHVRGDERDLVAWFRDLWIGQAVGRADEGEFATEKMPAFLKPPTGAA
jgi:hypothetical protein